MRRPRCTAKFHRSCACARFPRTPSECARSGRWQLATGPFMVRIPDFPDFTPRADPQPSGEDLAGPVRPTTSRQEARGILHRGRSNPDQERRSRESSSNGPPHWQFGTWLSVCTWAALGVLRADATARDGRQRLHNGVDRYDGTFGRGAGAQTNTKVSYPRPLNWLTLCTQSRAPPKPKDMP